MAGFDYPAWRASLEAATTAVLARFGFPADEHFVGGPSGGELVNAAQIAGTVPDGLLELYQYVSEVSLPDVHIGFFLHSLTHVLDNARTGMPVRAPGVTPRRIIVFGSDGGGALFALDGSGAPVYLLPVGAVRNGSYEGGLEAARKLADGLPEFLDWLLSTARGFAAGYPGAGEYPA